MGNCLVTKLKGSTSNNELLRIGEMRMRIAKVENPTGANRGFGISVNKPVVLEIVGDGYFTDKTLTVNKGKTITLNADVNGVWVSNDNVEIAILDKYSITALSSFYPQTSAAYGSRLYLNLSDLKYSTALTSLNLAGTQVTGDIANLKGLTALTSLNLYSPQVTGDIANLKGLTALASLNLAGPQVTGDIANLKGLTALTSLILAGTQVTGDIANLKGLTALTSLNFINIAQVTGDIANLKGLTALTSLNLRNTQVTGDIAAISPLSKLKDAQLNHVTGDISAINNTKLTSIIISKSGGLSGDIAKLKSDFIYLGIDSDTTSKFTWSSRDTNNYIFGNSGSPVLLSNLDDMLINMSQCRSGITSTSPIYYKSIQYQGNRTSASDEAVATLQQKGYTISIAKA